MSTGPSASNRLHCWFLRISCNSSPLPIATKQVFVMPILSICACTYQLTNKVSVQQIGKNVDAGWGEKLVWEEQIQSIDNNPVCESNQLFKFKANQLVDSYHSCAICRAHSNDRIAFSIWRDDHDPVNMVSEGQNSSIMLASYACIEELNTRVVSHTCDK